jgi:hypothetical protein
MIVATQTQWKATAPGEKLKKGDRVVITGLQTTTEYNGKHATIISIPKSTNKNVEKTRYRVEIDGVAEAKKIKLVNLSKIGESSKKHNIFQLGDSVILRGLKTTKYNNQHGTIFALSDPSIEGRYGVKIESLGEVIHVRPSNIFSSSVQSTYTKTSIQKLKKERDTMVRMVEYTEEECVGTDQMALMRMMMTTCLSKAQQVHLFGREVTALPDYRLELLQQGTLPKGVDKKWANNRLRLTFEQDSALPHIFELCFKNPKYKPSVKDILKRLGTNDVTKMRWYFGVRSPGSIYANYRAHPYGSCVRHNFSNQAYRKERLQQGKTHVAIGFVDLGLLLAADLAPGNGPLRFLGVERSAFAVAKARVVWELLLQTPSTPPERERHLYSVMQVWYSSTWTSDTEKRVKKVLRSLRLTEQSHHPEVQRLFEHWYNAPTMPLEKARREYAESITNSDANTGKLLRKLDRMVVHPKIQISE